jgi:hypothetical protein
MAMNFSAASVTPDLLTHQRVRNQFLCHLQFVRRQAVDTEQQPPAQLLVDRVVPVANGSLGHLRDQRLGIAQQ